MRRRKSDALGAGIGTRDLWITIQAKPDTGPADSGFPVDAPWADLVILAVFREDVTGDEITRSGAYRIAVSTTRWEIPYRADCDPELVDVPKFRRLLVHGRPYDIVSASAIGRHRSIEFVTEADTKTPTEVAAP